MHKKAVKLVKVENKLYLISLTDEIKSENLCVFSVGGNLVLAYPEDLLGDEIEWVGKVVVWPPNIGLNKLDNFYFNISEETIEAILKVNGGDCFIEMDVFLSEDNGYRSPRIINNKVIISW